MPRGSDVARRAIPQEEIAALLDYAGQHDTTGLANNYLRDFRTEFSAKRFNFAAGSTYTYRTGELTAGQGYDTAWTGPQAVKDYRKLDAGVRGSAGSTFVAGAAALVRGTLDEVQLVAASTRVGAWVGRRALGFGTGHGGGLVVDEHRFDGGGVFLARPVNVPLVGPIRFESHISRVENVLNLNGSQGPTKPYFWLSRFSFEPVTGFRVGINKGMMFGGEGNVPVTFGRLLRSAVGVSAQYDDELSFANQVVSVDGRLHPPVNWPLSLYLDWAADDGAGGWWHTPAILGGVEVGVSAKHDIMIGAERTEIARNRASNSLWYQNAWFRGGWADDGTILGHPLGGEGKEWRAFIFGGDPGRGVQLQLSGYTRTRGTQNLFAMDRAGKSVGAFADADIRIDARTHAIVRAETEHGTSGADWTRTRLRAGARFTLSY